MDGTKRVQGALSERGFEPRSQVSILEHVLQYGEAPYRGLTRADGEWLLAASKRALEQAIREQDTTAVVDEALNMPLAWIAAVNEHPLYARTLLDLCLLKLRTILNSDDPNRTYLAELTATQCVRLSPGVEPTEGQHKPEMMRVFRRAQQSTRASLLVQGHRRCDVLANGRKVGRTMEPIRQVPGPYVVQVRCDDQAGLLHQVNLQADQRLELPVDIDLERALRAVADNAEDAAWVNANGGALLVSTDEHVIERAAESLRRALGVDHLVLVRAAGGSAVKLSAVDAAGAWTRVHMAGPVETAVNALFPAE